VPTVRTDEITDAIVEGLSQGIPLRQLCRANGVSKSAVYDWIKADENLAGRVARARDIGFEELAEETLEIADDATNDWMARENGGEVVNAEHVSRSKLRIETRLKLLACWDPRRYGNKQLIGSDPENPLPAPTGIDMSKLSLAALQELSKLDPDT